MASWATQPLKVFAGSAIVSGAGAIFPGAVVILTDTGKL